MFILGCHRSGTSLVAGVLSEFLAEVNPGSQLNTAWIDSNLDNPNGFNESKALMETNKELLRLTGCNWEKPFLVRPDWSQLESYINIKRLRNRLNQWITNNAWVDKDPRLCLTREAYMHLFLKDVDTIAVIRDPISVANSLFMRNGMRIEKGLGIWLIYNHFLFNTKCSAPKATIIYNQIDSSSEAFSEKIVSGLNPNVLALEQSRLSVDEATRLLDTKFRHQFSSHLERSEHDLSPLHLADNELIRAAKTAYTSIIESDLSNNPKILANIFHESFHKSFDILQDLFPLRFSQKTLNERKPRVRAYRMLSLFTEKLQSLAN